MKINKFIIIFLATIVLCVITINVTIKNKSKDVKVPVLLYHDFVTELPDDYKLVDFNYINTPQSFEEKVNLEYFSDAVFIGNSRTEGFILNNGLASKTTAYMAKGLQVNTIFTDKVI